MRIAFAFNLQRELSEAQAEFDTATTVSMITAALEGLGHEVQLVNVCDPLDTVIDRLRRIAPDLVFNTAEGERGRGREALFPAVFEHLGLAYTGSDSLTCAVTLDKALSKQLVAARGVRVARGFLARRPADFDRAWDAFPALIKPNGEGSSKGIDGRSISADPAELRERGRELLERFPAGVVVEELIDGIDLVVPYLEAVGVLEPATYLHHNRGAGAIYDYGEKLHGFDDLEIQMPGALTAEQRRAAIDATREVIDTLEVRDLARLDFRLSADGELVFLEVNALPSLEAGASLYLAGALAGLEGTAGVIAAVIESAIARQGSPQRNRRQPLVPSSRSRPRIDSAVPAK